MNKSSEPHVFISYVREDRRLVETLCGQLRHNDIAVWLDREKIRPGQRWQIAIRRAIEEGAFFIACFSKSYSLRAKSYMNVELSIAVEQLRARPTDRAWFIPILFEGGAVPERPIGGGETLRDFQWVDLSDEWNSGVERILSVLRPEERLGSAPARREDRTVTILVTDLVGSSSIAGRTEFEDFSRLLLRVNTELLQIVAAHEGHATKLMGDGMIAEFELASNAIACALAIQDHMNASNDLRELRMRIGLSAGVVPQERGSDIGIAANLAVRVCSVARSGQILMSEAVRPLGVGERIQLRELGPTKLKGFPERVLIYEVRRAAVSVWTRLAHVPIGALLHRATFRWNVFFGSLRPGRAETGQAKSIIPPKAKGYSED
jgi:class 3 adenylate cyclase